MSLHQDRDLSPSGIKGYKSIWSLVFSSKLPEIDSSLILRDLLRSCYVARPRASLTPLSWDKEAVLRTLRSPPYEPIETYEFRALTVKTLFLVALATAEKVGELQAFSFGSPRLARTWF